MSDDDDQMFPTTVICNLTAPDGTVLGRVELAECDLRHPGCIGLWIRDELPPELLPPLA